MFERRKYPRFRILSDIIIRPVGSGKRNLSEIHCVGYDLSQGGFGFICIKALELKREYAIRIKSFSTKLSGHLVSEGEVMDMPGMKKYGIEFHVPLRLAELEQLLKSVGRSNRDGKELIPMYL